MGQGYVGQITFGTKLLRARDTPIRLAFATLTGSHQFWAFYVLGLPAVALSAALIHPLFVSIAAGVPIAICLLILWLSHQLIHPQLIINADDRTLSISNQAGSSMSSSIDLDDIGSISVVQFGHAALVNIHYHELELWKPYATAIKTTEVTELKPQLEHENVSVRQASSASVWGRVITTPFVILGTIVAIWQLFGSEAFVTGAVVVPAIVLVLVAMESFWKRYLR